MPRARAPSFALVTLGAVATSIVGCASDFKSFYRETDHELQPKPVAAENVGVVRAARDLSAPWSALGSYEGYAPTVKAAMDAAKHACGRAGADYFILDVAPFESRGVWNVEGLCAAKTAALPVN